MTSPVPVVSVIVCVLNGAPTLLAQLRALGAQAGAPPFEVLIVDNGSTDGSPEIVRAWSAAGTGAALRVRLVDAADRRGLCHARNTGARAATGEILAFCDCDDVVTEGWVAAVAAGIAAGHEVLAGRVYALTPAGKPSEEILLDAVGSVEAPGTPDGSVPFAWGCNFAVTAGTFFRVGGFDESLPPYGGDDVDFGLRLASAGIGIGYEPRMAIHYRQTTGVRARFRRQYRTGVAQACLWARHPQVYGPPPRTLRLCTDVVSAPVRKLFTLRGNVKFRVYVALMTLALRAGTVTGMRRWVVNGRLGAPVLASSTPER